MKRAFDLALSALGLILLLPVFLLSAAAIRIESPGPAFFRQERIGKGGVPFRIFKFRSMVTGAPGKGARITVAGDPRVTRVGRFLRRTKLDELPQLINVLKGEMSLVGPRPEVRRYVDLYDDRQQKVLSVRPGITDPASIRYAEEERLLAERPDPLQAYVNEIMPRKLALNLEYIETMSLARDLGILVRTVLRVLGLRSGDRG